MSLSRVAKKAALNVLYRPVRSLRAKLRVQLRKDAEALVSMVERPVLVRSCVGVRQPA